VVKRFAILLLLGAAAAAGGWWLRNRLVTPYRGFSEPEVFVDLPAGASLSTIGRRMAEAGVVPDPLTFRVAAWFSGAERRLQAGEYRFAAPATALDVVDRLSRGDVFRRPVTFPEGLTIRQMAALFESSGLGHASTFERAAASAGERVEAFDPAADSLEGYLFPDTYPLPRQVDADALVGLMVTRFARVFDDELRGRAASRGLSIRQAVTLASLVEKETAHPDERPIVAAVYHNRLRRGMPLQCDPTVIYALMRAGRWTGNLRRADLQFDSPYNTYRYAGLPPGPIASPGAASLEAAVAPADVSYLYFVSRNDGTHAFATTLAEHNRNVAEWQVRYFRDRRLQSAIGDR
jgi:UPF0755 protein